MGEPFKDELLQKCRDGGKGYQLSTCPFAFGLRLQGNQINQIPTKYSQAESTKFLILTVVSILCIVAVLLASTVVYCLRHRSHHKLKEKLTNLGTDTPGDATTTYQVGGAAAPSGLFAQSHGIFGLCGLRVCRRCKIQIEVLADFINLDNRCT